MLRKDMEKCINYSRSEFTKKSILHLVKTEPWLRSSEGLLAIVDLNILTIYRESLLDGNAESKKRKIMKALACASDTDFYKTVIPQEIKKRLDDENIFSNICDALRSAIDNCKHKGKDEEDDVTSMEKALRALKEEAIKKQLVLDISSSLQIVNSLKLNKSIKFDQTTSNILSEVAEYLSVDSVKQGFHKSSITVDIYALYAQLGREMRNEGALQPRCGTPCGTCKMPCSEEEHHDSNLKGTGKLHNCSHQPQGFAHIRRTESQTLRWESCVDSKTLKQTFKLIPYEKWHELICPGWVELSPLRRRPIREFLFYNCQDELVCFLNEFLSDPIKRCDDLEKSGYDRWTLSEMIKDAEQLAFDKV